MSFGTVEIKGDNEVIYRKNQKSLDYGLGVFAAYTILLPHVFFELFYNTKNKSSVLDDMVQFTSEIENKDYDGYLPRPGFYNWWIYFHDKTDCGKKIYRIIEFSHMDFIIGFVQTFETYNAEFRDYAVWAPYTTNPKKDLVHIHIDGYDMHYFNTKKVVRYGVIPYST